MQSVKQELDALKAQNPEMNTKVFQKEHIDRLFKYNQIKDIGQMLLGLCAEQSKTTVADMYLKFDLSLDD